MSTAQEEHDAAEMRSKVRSHVKMAETDVMMLALVASVAAPRGGDKDALKLKVEAMFDTFKQSFQLLRDIIDGK